MTSARVRVEIVAGGPNEMKRTFIEFLTDLLLAAMDSDEKKGLQESSPLSYLKSRQYQNDTCSFSSLTPLLDHSLGPALLTVPINRNRHI